MSFDASLFKSSISHPPTRKYQASLIILALGSLIMEWFIYVTLFDAVEISRIQRRAASKASNSA